MNDTDFIVKRLRDADPLRNVQLQVLDVDEFLATLRSPVAGEDRVVRLAPRRHRKTRLAFIASAAAVALLAFPVVSSRIGEGTPGTGPQWGVPNAAAAELNSLAKGAVAGSPRGSYLYTSQHQLVLSSLFTSLKSAPVRWRSDSVVQRWQGTRCQDRQIETWQPYRFLSPADKAAWQAYASQPTVSPQEKSAAAGGTRTSSGSDLWPSAPAGQPANPCKRGGSLQNPTPAYVASLPSEPDALLSRLASEARADQISLSDALTEILGWPWLTQAQREAAIEALGLVPEPWTVTRTTTAGGHQALILAFNRDGLRNQMIVSAAAPGIWKQTVTITDPAKAGGSDSPYAGLPAGTVVELTEVTSAAVVSSAHAKP